MKIVVLEVMLNPISYLVLCLVSEKMRKENEAVNKELGYKLFATDFILFVKLR